MKVHFWPKLATTCQIFVWRHFKFHLEISVATLQFWLIFVWLHFNVVYKIVWEHKIHLHAFRLCLKFAKPGKTWLKLARLSKTWQNLAKIG